MHFPHAVLDRLPLECYDDISEDHQGPFETLGSVCAYLDIDTKNLPEACLAMPPSLGIARIWSVRPETCVGSMIVRRVAQRICRVVIAVSQQRGNFRNEVEILDKAIDDLSAFYKESVQTIRLQTPQGATSPIHKGDDDTEKYLVTPV